MDASTVEAVSRVLAKLTCCGVVIIPIAYLVVPPIVDYIRGIRCAKAARPGKGLSQFLEECRSCPGTADFRRGTYERWCGSHRFEPVSLDMFTDRLRHEGDDAWQEYLSTAAPKDMERFSLDHFRSWSKTNGRYGWEGRDLGLAYESEARKRAADCFFSIRGEASTGTYAEYSAWCAANNRYSLTESDFHRCLNVEKPGAYLSDSLSTCEHCSGTGKGEMRVTTCSWCHGDKYVSAQVRVPRGILNPWEDHDVDAYKEVTDRVTCRECGGSGTQMKPTVCPNCNGSGQARKSRTVVFDYNSISTPACAVVVAQPGATPSTSPIAPPRSPTLSPVTSTWHMGDRAFAPWLHDKYWYPASIVEIEGQTARVRFDDGEYLELALSALVEDTVDVGTRVGGNWRHLGSYYPGVIAGRTGDRVHIRYDDGGEEDTTISAVRIVRTTGSR